MKNRNRHTPVTFLAVAMVVGLALATAGCGGDDDSANPGAPTTNPYAGDWSVVFSGNYTGGGQITISSDGSCSEDVVLNDPATGDFTNTVQFDVLENGSVDNGRIYYSGAQIGTISGSFDGNSGSGNWQTSIPTSGTWSASR